MAQVRKQNMCGLENGTPRKRQAGGIRQMGNLGSAGRTQRGKQDIKNRQTDSTERPPWSPNTATTVSQKTEIDTSLQSQNKEMEKDPLLRSNK